jgi:hypothetical protein
MEKSAEINITVSYRIEPGERGDRETPEVPSEVEIDFVRTDSGQEVELTDAERQEILAAIKEEEGI